MIVVCNLVVHDVFYNLKTPQSLFNWHSHRISWLGMVIPFGFEHVEFVLPYCRSYQHLDRCGDLSLLLWPTSPASLKVCASNLRRFHLLVFFPPLFAHDQAAEAAQGAAAAQQNHQEEEEPQLETRWALDGSRLVWWICSACVHFCTCNHGEIETI